MNGQHLASPPRRSPPWVRHSLESLEKFLTCRHLYTNMPDADVQARYDLLVKMSMPYICSCDEDLNQVWDLILGEVLLNGGAAKRWIIPAVRRRQGEDEEDMQLFVSHFLAAPLGSRVQFSRSPTQIVESLLRDITPWSAYWDTFGIILSFLAEISTLGPPACLALLNAGFLDVLLVGSAALHPDHLKPMQAAFSVAHSALSQSAKLNVSVKEVVERHPLSGLWPRVTFSATGDVSAGMIPFEERYAAWRHVDQAIVWMRINMVERFFVRIAEVWIAEEVCIDLLAFSTDPRYAPEVAGEAARILETLLHERGIWVPHALKSISGDDFRAAYDSCCRALRLEYAPNGVPALGPEDVGFDNVDIAIGVPPDYYADSSGIPK